MCSISGQGLQSLSLSTHRPVASSHLLQEEVSLVRAEWCTDLWVQQCAIRSHLWLCSFSRIVVVGCPLWSLTYLVSGSWPCWQCQVWVPTHEAVRASNQKVVVYVFNTCATTSPALRSECWVFRWGPWSIRRWVLDKVLDVLLFSSQMWLTSLARTLPNEQTLLPPFCSPYPPSPHSGPQATNLY